MDDCISRGDAIKAVLVSNFSACTVFGRSEEGMATAKELIQVIKNLPSAQPEIIRCKDCRWWDKYGDYDNGYCMAAKHGYWSEHWEIIIRRTYKGDFYCADAEPKGEFDNEAEEEDDEGKQDG